MFVYFFCTYNVLLFSFFKEIKKKKKKNVLSPSAILYPIYSHLKHNIARAWAAGRANRRQAHRSWLAGARDSCLFKPHREQREGVLPRRTKPCHESEQGLQIVVLLRVLSRDESDGYTCPMASISIVTPNRATKKKKKACSSTGQTEHALQATTEHIFQVKRNIHHRRNGTHTTDKTEHILQSKRNI